MLVVSAATGVLLVFVAFLSAGHVHATLSGFPDLRDLQRDAAQLHLFTVRHAQTVLFPTITFTCTGRVTNLTFMAAKPTTIFPGLSSMTTDPQIGVWRTDDDRHRRVSPEMNITVDQLTEISPSVFKFSPDNMDFSDGDYLGLYQPSEGERTIDLILQGGGGPENVYAFNADPISDILFTDSSNDRNDYPLVSVQTDPPGCAEGFLTTEVLEEHVQVQLQVLETVSYEREQRLVPGINFTCDATLNKWTVAGQISEGSSHPELQVWGLQSELDSGNFYNRTGFPSFPLVGSDLQPRSDQRNVYEFTPDEEVTISSGSVLGLFQPALDQSSFIVYYQSNSGPQNYGSGNRDTPRSTLQASSDNEEGNNYPLVTVDVTPVHCATGFISADSLTEQALFLATFADVYGQQRIIPAMNITQDGLLTKWTFAARDLGEAIERTEYPELQILRLNSGDMYNIVHKTNSSEQPSRTRFLNVYEYLPNLPLRVRAGDILGFRQPPESSSRLSLAVIEGAGPPNEIMEPNSRKRQTNTANDLPLILVDIDSTTVSPSPPVNPGGESSSPAAAIAGAIVGVLVAVGVIAAIVIIIVCVVKRRKMSKQRSNRFSDNPMDNPIYGGDTTEARFAVGSEKLLPSDGNYNAPSTANTANDASVYATPDGGGKAHGMDNPDYLHSQEVHHYSSANNYETAPFPGPGQSSSDPWKHYEWGIYVPTKQQRKGIPSVLKESVYATLGEAQQCGSGDTAFFTESETYWAPAKDEDELYQQLASKKYREIPRPQIQTQSHLGSGQFGTVCRGVWYSPRGGVEVAVKMLQKSSKEDQVKFLQEAAINGQFKHPNVVKLHGVVTVGEPVMIVLELLTNRDLRHFLIKQQPDPGELVSPDMPNTLLRFCREIASGMQYLSGKAFVHRDLAARNILVAEDKTCKISDFGMSRDLVDETYYVSHGGQIPVKWTAPEALHFKKYSTASDVWSFGAVMYEIWSLGHKPFEEYTNVQSIKMLDNGFRLPPPPGCPKEIYKLMISCWNPVKSQRLTFTQLLQKLSQPETRLLIWSEEDCSVHQQAAVLGAPLEAGKELYPELQNSYKKP